MLRWFTEDIEAWYRKLRHAGVEIELPPKDSDYIHVKTMLFKDPEATLSRYSSGSRSRMESVEFIYLK